MASSFAGHAFGRGTLSAILAVLCGVLAGCQRYEYDIQLKPTDEGLERSVKLRTVNGASGPGREQLKKIYGAAPPEKEMGKAVELPGKVFHGETPQDVGGAGRFVRFESLLGNAFGYIERFRGNDDLYTQFEARRKAVDEFTDQLLHWFGSELENEPGWPAVQQFLDKTLRIDLHNVSLYASPLHLLSERESDQPQSPIADVILRGAQYLVERGYFTYEELPAVARLAHGMNERETTEAVFVRFRDTLLKKLENSQPQIPREKFSFLSDPAEAEKSWKAYFEGTAYFQQEMTRLMIEDERKIKKLAESPDSSPQEVALAERALADRRAKMANEVLGDLLHKAFVPWFDLRGFDKVKLTLAVASQPVWTNGKWNADAKTVVWANSVDAPDDKKPARPLDVPAYCFAIWDEPAEEAQQKLFGEVAVRAGDLLQFCFWYQGLSSDERRQWDEFASTLKRDNASERALKAFHFEGEPPNTKEKRSAAWPGSKIIGKALKLFNE